MNSCSCVLAVIWCCQVLNRSVNVPGYFSDVVLVFMGSRRQARFRLLSDRSCLSISHGACACFGFFLLAPLERRSAGAA